MAATVKRFTKQDQATYVEGHPRAEPKEWAVMDGKLVFGFHDTLLAAQVEADSLKFDDQLGEDFNQWIDTIMTKYPEATLEHIYGTIAARCHGGM